MADQPKKITELPVGTASIEDLLVVVDNMETTPVTKKVTVGSVLALGGGGGGGGVVDVLYTGPSAPIDPSTELWLDTDEPTIASGVQDVLHEGATAPTDPAIELWVDTAESTGSVVAAKGDLIVGTGPDQIARQIVGSPGQVLTADALQPTGMRWSTINFPAGSFPFVPFTPFSVAGWTWVNQGPAGVTEGNNIVFVSCPSISGENQRLLVKAMPAGTPTITLALMRNLVWRLDAQIFGLGLRESATGKINSFGINTGSSGVTGHALHYWTNPTTWSSAPVNIATDLPHIFWLRVAVTATQYVFSVSYDGVNFTQLLAPNKNAFFTTAADQVGLVISNRCGQPIGVSYLSWLET